MKFRVSYWYYFFVAINLIIASLFGSLYILFPEANIGAISEFTVLAGIFLLMVIVGFWQMITAFVIVDGDELMFRFGFNVVKVDLKETRGVYPKSLFLILDHGQEERKQRIVIPRIFSNMPELIKLVERTLRSFDQ